MLPSLCGVVSQPSIIIHYSLISLTSVLSNLPGIPRTVLGIRRHNTGEATSYSFNSFPISYFSRDFSSFACRIPQWLRPIQIILSPPTSCWGKLVYSFAFRVLLRVCSLEGQGMKCRLINTYQLFLSSPKLLDCFSIQNCFLESCCIAFLVAS